MNAPAKEEWRVIADFPAYAVSDQGRVKRIVPKAGGQMFRDPVLKPVLNNHGYYQVGLWRDGKQITKGIHRLVCLAFHGSPPSSAHETAHGDGNRLNNCASNLRWATRLENERDKFLHGTTARGERQSKAKLTEADIRAIRADRRRSHTAIGRDYGVTGENISFIRRRVTWRHVA